jgi:hypothetical protein
MRPYWSDGLGGKKRGRSQVFGLQASAFGNPGEHSRTDFLAVVKRENDVGPARSGESFV